MTKEDKKKKGLSRRKMFGAIAGAAATGAAVTSALAQRGGAPAANAPLRPTGAGSPINSTSLDGMPEQGGNGPIRVLFLTSYHAFDRENLYRMLDRFGTEITWTHVEHPAAERFYDPALAEDFDVYLFYDAFAGRRSVTGPDGQRRRVNLPPSARTQANLKQLLTNGDKGFVIFHHALSSWVHTWPPGVNGTNAYVEMMGGAADWGADLQNLRGRTYPRSGYRQGTEQRFTVTDRTHPVMAGVDDFSLVDEPYQCAIFEDSIQPLLRTSFQPTTDKFAYAPNGANVGAGHPPGSNVAAWVKTAENTPLVYIQPGHDNNAWSHPAYQRMMLNAIRWTASPAAKTWARANSKRIFV